MPLDAGTVTREILAQEREPAEAIAEGAVR
jgi:hypothetical protein